MSLNIHPVKRSILFQEEGVATVTELHKKLDPGAAPKLKMVLKDLHMDARFLNYCNYMYIKMTVSEESTGTCQEESEELNRFIRRRDVKLPKREDTVCLSGVI